MDSVVFVVPESLSVRIENSSRRQEPFFFFFFFFFSPLAFLYLMGPRGFPEDGENCRDGKENGRGLIPPGIWI